MRLDIGTLSFILCFSSILQIIGIYSQVRLNKSFPGTKYWVIGNTLTTFGTFFMFMRVFTSNKFIAIILSNNLILLGEIILYIGIVRFLGKKEKRCILSGTYGIFLITFLYFTYINDNITLRVVIFSIALAIVSMLSAVELLCNEKALYMSSYRFTGGIFLLYGLFFAIRPFLTIAAKQSNGIFNPSMLYAIMFLVSIASGYLWSFGLIILINQRTNAEKAAAQEKVNRVNEKIKVLSQAVEQSPTSIVITDINGSIQYVNKKYIELTGYSYEEAIGNNPRVLKSGLTAEEVYKELWSTVLIGNEWRGEFHNKKKNGELYWESANISPIFNEKGDMVQLLAVKEDITERKRLEMELQMQARTDELTGIPNRRCFMETMENELLRNQRYPRENAYLMLDIDHFKEVNDNFGHAFGDSALKLVANTCKNTVRSSDIIGRIGGEEFAIFLIETDYEEAKNIAERLRENVENIKLFDTQGVQIKLSISIGMTKYKLKKDTLMNLMERSDRALYKAKNEGRNRLIAAI